MFIVSLGPPIYIVFCLVETPILICYDELPIYILVKLSISDTFNVPVIVSPSLNKYLLANPGIVI